MGLNWQAQYQFRRAKLLDPRDGFEVKDAHRSFGDRPIEEILRRMRRAADRQPLAVGAERDRKDFSARLFRLFGRIVVQPFRVVADPPVAVPRLKGLSKQTFRAESQHAPESFPGGQPGSVRAQREGTEPSSVATSRAEPFGFNPIRLAGRFAIGNVDPFEPAVHSAEIERLTAVMRRERQRTHVALAVEKGFDQRGAG